MRTEIPESDRILAIDAASKRVGFAVLDGQYVLAGAFAVHRGDIAGRLRQIGARISNLVRFHRPDVVAIESPEDAASYRVGRTGQVRSALTTRGIFLAVGVCVEAVRAAREEETPVVLVSAQDVKEAIARRRMATKAEVQHSLVLMGFTLPRMGSRVDHDAADALALAVMVRDERARDRMVATQQSSTGRDMPGDGS